MKTLLIIMLFCLSSCGYKQLSDEQCRQIEPLRKTHYDFVYYNRHCNRFVLDGGSTVREGTIEITTKKDGSTTTRTTTTKYRIR